MLHRLQCTTRCWHLAIQTLEFHQHDCANGYLLADWCHWFRKHDLEIKWSVLFFVFLKQNIAGCFSYFIDTHAVDKHHQFGVIYNLLFTNEMVRSTVYRKQVTASIFNATVFLSFIALSSHIVNRLFVSSLQL